MSGTFIPQSVVDAIAGRGRKVVIWDGAPTRSASKGGFTSLQGVIMHHTADTPPHGASTWQYTLTNPDNSPEYNFGVDLDGTINWLAAGGVNSSGKGGALQMQTGSIAQDGANYVVPAVALDIDGVGETCSAEMMISAVVCAGELIAWMGRQPGDVTAHKEYCGPGTSTPGRKPDPFGPWGGGPWGGDGAVSWGPQQGRIDSFRSEVWWYLCDPVSYLANATGTVPAPPTPSPSPEPPTPAPSPADWWTPLMDSLPVLAQGATGAAVKRMQHLLAAAGFMNPANTANYDGVFGGGTAGALNNFKQAAGGQPDGTCDGWTWGALMYTIDGIPDLVCGDEGDDVRRMQHLLAAAGYMNEANTANYDSQWGSGTDGAKCRFDTDRGLIPSPPTDCGQQSWTALLS